MLLSKQQNQTLIYLFKLQHEENHKNKMFLLQHVFWILILFLLSAIKRFEASKQKPKLNEFPMWNFFDNSNFIFNDYCFL